MPARADILRDIVATLETIRVANGYLTDVAHVELGIRTWAEVSAAGKNLMPYIGVAPDDDKAVYERVVNGVYDVTLPIVIGVHVSASDADERLDMLDALEDDILTALRVDPRRNGNAIATHPRTLGTDEADSLKLPHGTGIFEWVVEYQRNDLATPTEERVHYADLSVSIGGGAPANVVAAWDGSVPITNWVQAQGAWSAQGLPLVGFSQPNAGETILRYTGARRRLFKVDASLIATGAGLPHAGIATRPDPASPWTVLPQTVRQSVADNFATQALVSLVPNAEIAVFVGNLLNVDDITVFGGLIVTEV